MNLFFVKLDDLSDSEEVIVRAEDAKRAASIYVTMASSEESAPAGDKVRVMTIPSPSGKPQNYGFLNPSFFGVDDLPPIEKEFLTGEAFPTGLTNMMIVRIEDMNGDDWDFVIEASDAEEARDLAIAGYLSGDDIKDTNGVHKILIQRIPAEKGEEAVLDWDSHLEIGFEFEAAPQVS